jgi:hypothetical protein
MPDRRSHRGPHPEDGELFSPQAVPAIHRGVADLSWLLAQGYADKGALKLVGDRFSLTERQRVAVMRSACSDPQRTSRQARCIPVTQLAGHSVAVDGYNLLITVEAALSGGVLLRGRDGCLRDLASIHGTYRRVEETLPAVELIGRLLEVQAVSEVLWLLDRPVSNSGRLKTLAGRTQSQSGRPAHPDRLGRGQHRQRGPGCVPAMGQPCLRDRPARSTRCERDRSRVPFWCGLVAHAGPFPWARALNPSA